MKRTVDLTIISRLAIILLIGFVFIYLIYSMERFGDGQSDRQTSSVEKIINKALVQCYALEGSYPVDVEYVQKYGVIFDNDKYLYYYEWYGSNLRPSIFVIER